MRTMASDTDTIDVSDLSARVIDENPRDYDFRAGGLEDWRVAFKRTDEETRNERFEPMMNTLWPLPDDFSIPEDVRDRLDNMTIVVVYGDREVEGTHLALTGGGMDMSWHIARTYVNLGLLPPAALGTLPEMGGMDFGSEANRRVIEAVKRSNQLMIDRYRRNVDELNRLGD